MNFIEKGGQVLVFPPLQSGQKILNFINPGSVEKAKPDNYFDINTWDELSGPLANSRQGETLPVNKLYVSARQLPASTGEVLATYRDGKPFLSRYGHGKGAVYYCSSGVEKKWSDLYKGAVLLPMIRRLVNDGARQYSSVLEQNCRFEDSLNNLKPIVGDSTAAFKSLSAGVYEQDTGMVMLNRPELEDQQARISEKDIEALFDGLDFAMFNQTSDESSDTLQSELFSLFAIFLIIFLAVEGFLTLRKPVQELEGKA